MLNYSSVAALGASLPAIPDALEPFVGLTIDTPQRIKADSIMLARHGCLGMLAFARHGNEKCALFLRPGQPLDRCQIVLCDIRKHLAYTIAPALGELIAGAMAYHAPRHQPHVAARREEILQLAGAFGSVRHAEAVLALLGPALDPLDTGTARATLYAACADEPWFHVLAQVWTVARAEAAQWAEQMLAAHPAISVPWRIYASYHALARSGRDVSGAAWHLILGDDVADAAYTGRSIGLWESWGGRPLLAVVKWLQAHGDHALTSAYPLLWQAAQALAADPNGYEGAAHLAFARQIAAADPALAYTHAANAAFYYAHATGQAPLAAIAFAHDLAEQQQWEHLRTVLGWARDGIRK